MSRHGICEESAGGWLYRGNSRDSHDKGYDF